jgi:hypothetical protein
MRLLAPLIVGVLIVWAVVSSAPSGSSASGPQATRTTRARCLDVFRPAPGGPARPGHDPRSFTVGDFNEDARLDLAVVRNVGGTASPNASAVSSLVTGIWISLPCPKPVRR